MKIGAVVFGLVLMAVGCGKDKVVCHDQADEVCPAASDYATLKVFVDKYKAPQDEQDRVYGVVLRLQQSAPSGYHFDGNKLKYVKNPAPVAPAAK